MRFYLTLGIEIELEKELTIPELEEYIREILNCKTIEILSLENADELDKLILQRTIVSGTKH